MSDKKEARQDRAEEQHKKLLERLSSHDNDPHNFDAEKAEREKLLVSLHFEPTHP